jgi:type II restriction enzyme
MADHERSWRTFKGNNLERLLIHILTDEVKDLGLKIVSGNTLRQISANRNKIFDRVKRNLLVDCGEFGMHFLMLTKLFSIHLTGYVLAIISIKVTLRERIA